MKEVFAIVMPLLERFEGLRLKPYICPAGVPTIGLGSTRYLDGRPVTLADRPITKGHAYALAKDQLSREYLPGVLALCPGADSPERIAALTSWSYNLGLTALRGSTLRKRVNEQDWEAAVEQIMRWTRGGGRVLPGLVARRTAEAALLRVSR